MSTTTANMGLTKPTEATDLADVDVLNANTELIDAHQHIGGQGKQIPTAGILDRAITGIKIALATIAGENLIDRAITGIEIALGAILDEHVAANAAIAQSKISNAARSIDADKVDGYDASAFAAASHGHLTVPNHDHNGHDGDGGNLRYVRARLQYEMGSRGTFYVVNPRQQHGYTFDYNAAEFTSGAWYLVVDGANVAGGWTSIELWLMDSAGRQLAYTSWGAGDSGKKTVGFTPVDGTTLRLESRSNGADGNWGSIGRATLVFVPS